MPHNPNEEIRYHGPKNREYYIVLYSDDNLATLSVCKTYTSFCQILVVRLIANSFFKTLVIFVFVLNSHPYLRLFLFCF